jgi:hypothetical protein
MAAWAVWVRNFPAGKYGKACKVRTAFWESESNTTPGSTASFKQPVVVHAASVTFENLKAICNWMAGDLNLKIPSAFTHPVLRRPYYLT